MSSSTSSTDTRWHVVSHSGGSAYSTTILNAATASSPSPSSPPPPPQHHHTQLPPLPKPITNTHPSVKIKSSPSKSEPDSTPASSSSASSASSRRDYVAWSRRETDALVRWLSIDDNFNNMRRATTKMLPNLALHLQSSVSGCQKTPKQCDHKIRNLKKCYKRTKEKLARNNADSFHAAPQTLQHEITDQFPYFQQFEIFLAATPGSDEAHAHAGSTAANSSTLHNSRAPATTLPQQSSHDDQTSEEDMEEETHQQYQPLPAPPQQSQAQPKKCPIDHSKFISKKRSLEEFDHHAFINIQPKDSDSKEKVSFNRSPSPTSSAVKTQAPPLPKIGTLINTNAPSSKSRSQTDQQASSPPQPPQQQQQQQPQPQISHAQQQQQQIMRAHKRLRSSSFSSLSGMQIAMCPVVSGSAAAAAATSMCPIQRYDLALPISSLAAAVSATPPSNTVNPSSTLLASSSLPMGHTNHYAMPSPPASGELALAPPPCGSADLGNSPASPNVDALYPHQNGGKEQEIYGNEEKMHSTLLSILKIMSSDSSSPSRPAPNGNGASTDTTTTTSSSNNNPTANSAIAAVTSATLAAPLHPSPPHADDGANDSALSTSLTISSDDGSADVMSADDRDNAKEMALLLAQHIKTSLAKRDAVNRQQLQLTQLKSQIEREMARAQLLYNIGQRERGDKIMDRIDQLELELHDLYAQPLNEF